MDHLEVMIVVAPGWIFHVCTRVTCKHESYLMPPSKRSESFFALIEDRIIQVLLLRRSHCFPTGLPLLHSQKCLRSLRSFVELPLVLIMRLDHVFSVGPDIGIQKNDDGRVCSGLARGSPTVLGLHFEGMPLFSVHVHSFFSLVRILRFYWDFMLVLRYVIPEK